MGVGTAPPEEEEHPGSSPHGPLQARDVLRIKGVNVTVLNAPQNTTEGLLTEMLAELRRIRPALVREPPRENTSSSRQ